MADRQVSATRKDREGDILALCGGGDSWARMNDLAIQDIEDRVHTYHVMWTDGERTEIRVVNGQAGRYLRTDRDDTTRNNLDDLPDC